MHYTNSTLLYSALLLRRFSPQFIFPLLLFLLIFFFFIVIFLKFFYPLDLLLFFSFLLFSFSSYSISVSLTYFFLPLSFLPPFLSHSLTHSLTHSFSIYLTINPLLWSLAARSSLSCRAILAYMRILDLSLANITKGVLAADIYEGQSDPSSANWLALLYIYFYLFLFLLLYFILIHL